MRRKKQDVCGKPTQYNLQTMEYNWRELPNTKIQLMKQEPLPKHNSAPIQTNGSYTRYNKTKRDDSRSPEPKTPSHRTPLIPKGRFLVDINNHKRFSHVSNSLDKSEKYSDNRKPLSENNIYQIAQTMESVPKLPSLFPSRKSPEFQEGMITCTQPWSHDAIFHMLAANRTEAKRSYLPRHV
ncbi:unnamed protein product [Phytomonas sp. Hart1]|nr:unnamed protein product [Phytomonas sp. Hart1]|eukprot:CCW71730.1 unnamed protein product [Phytomonas sp. isolate Hart1]